MKTSTLRNSLAMLPLLCAIALASCTAPAEQQASPQLGQSISCPPSQPADPTEAKTVANGLLTINESLALWQERPADETRTGVTDEKIVIGSPQPLTGPLAPIASRPGFEALIQAVNEAGGIYGRKIEIRYEDNGGNAAQGVTAVQKLLQQDQVFAILGNQITAAVQATMDAIRAAGVPSIAPNSSITEQNFPTRSNLISFHVPGQVNGYVAGKRIAEKSPQPRVAFIYQNDEYGQASVAGVEHSITNEGGTVVARQPFTLGASTDFTSAVSAAVNANPDVLFIEAQAPQARTIMSTLRNQLGSDVPVFFGTGMPQWYNFGDPALDGTQGYVFVEPFLDESDPQARTAKEFFTQHGVDYSGTVGGIAWLDIQQVQLLLHGLALAGPDPTREALIAAYNCGFQSAELGCASCLAPFDLSQDDHWANSTLQLTRYSHATRTVEEVGEPVTVDINKILTEVTGGGT